VDGEDEVASLECHHPSVNLAGYHAHSSGCTIMGIANAENRCMVNQMQVEGGLKVPVRMPLKACKKVVASPNKSNSGDVRNGVWFACVYLWLASARHFFKLDFGDCLHLLLLIKGV